MTDKTVVVISKKWRGEMPLLLNAVGHIAQALAHQATKADHGEFVDYETADDVRFNGVSAHPFIVLTGTSTKMWSFKTDCEKSGLITSAFVEAMFHGGTTVQLQSTASRTAADHDLICVGAYGNAEQVDGLTKRFSLFRT